jgi:hypothetical protein
MKTVRPEAPTPQNVAEMATEKAKLPRRVLLGIFGSADAPAALVRNNKGDTDRVSVGDTVDGDTVLAIGDDNIVITQGGRSEVLRLPAG